jgi:MFS family permease
VKRIIPPTFRPPDGCYQVAARLPAALTAQSAAYAGIQRHRHRGSRPTLRLVDGFRGVCAEHALIRRPRRQFGWGRGETAFGYTAIAFSSALFGIFWGYVADRFGTRWFGVVAAVVMSISLYLLSGQQTIFEFYAFYFLFGAFGTAMVSSPLFANVGFWFRKNPGLALGITASGGAFGQGVVPFLVGIAITNHGWQQAYLMMSITYLVIALPFAFLIRESPRRALARSTPEVEMRAVTLPEWEVVAWISVAIIFCCNCMAVPIVHLVPLLTDQGHTTSYATTALMVLMLSGALGRILGGKLGDMIGPLPAYMMMSLGQTVSVFWFPQMETTSGLYLLAIFFGFTYSGVMSSILVCTRMMVSAGFAARAMGITSFFGWGGMGLGGFLGGFFFDLSGGYQAAFAFAALMGAINLIVLILFKIRIDRHRLGDQSFRSKSISLRDRTPSKAPQAR